VLKNQERSLGIRRRSSIYEVEVYFQVLEWPAEVRRGWRFIYSPYKFLTVEVSEHRIYPTWIGYVRWKI
jgi:hypothetical protein